MFLLHGTERGLTWEQSVASPGNRAWTHLGTERGLLVEKAVQEGAVLPRCDVTLAVDTDAARPADQLFASR